MTKGSSVGRSGRRLRGADWRGVLVGVKDGVREDRLTLVSAGVAFYATVSLVPALAALVSVYGIFADPAAIGDQVGELTRGVPSEVTALLTEQLTRLTAAGRTSLGIGAVIATVVALWGASAGVQALLDGLGVTFEEGGEAGFLKKRGRALALTLGAIALAVVAIGLVVAVPVVLDHLPAGDAARTLASVLRWPLLAVVVVAALAVLYRMASTRTPSSGWLTPGAVLGTVLWLVGSGLFSLYVTHFGRYAAYGSLGAVLVLLLWFWVSALTILLGARVDVELERVAAAGGDGTCDATDAAGQSE